MKVCVVGGSGFIGTNLVDKLHSLNHEVIILDKNISKKYFKIVQIGDVREKNSIVKASNGCDVIYNLAAEHRDDVTPYSLYYDVNVQGAKNIAQAADENNIKRIVFTSTVAVYGLNKSNPDEACQASPFNHYGKSKFDAELVLKHWVEQGDGRSLVIVRPVVVFGEGNRGNVYNLIKQIQAGKFMMVGSGDNKKSMAYVENIAIFLAEAVKFNSGMHVFNFATKPDMKVRELVDFIRTELQLTGKVPNLPYAAGIAGGLVFDLISKITGRKYSVSSIRVKKFCAETTVSTNALDAIGFVSPFTLEQGLARMIANIDHDIYFEGGG